MKRITLLLVAGMLVMLVQDIYAMGQQERAGRPRNVRWANHLDLDEDQNRGNMLSRLRAMFREDLPALIAFVRSFGYAVFFIDDIANEDITVLYGGDDSKEQEG